jgi:hypothetical protein
MSYLEAKYVTLTGNMTIGGMNTRNFDALRDQCVLHLHQETGGVLVKRGEDVFFISPVAITSVELYESPNLGTTVGLSDEEAETPFWNKDAKRGDAVGTIVHETKVPKAMLTPLVSDEAVAKGARNLADEVLAELGEPSVKSPTQPGKRIRAAKKN